jgi:NADPH-dependent glutamate synthase beta subunit-like oxidoreductase
MAEAPAARHVVLIVGGAVSGAEAAAQFTARGVRCIVVEQNPRPYGKIEDGLPRWHVKLRESEEDKIDQKLAHPDVLFVPSTKLGKDIMLEELRAWGLSAIVLANGAWRDRPLPVPHADNYVDRGLYYQNPFVMWFNHYIEPGYAGPQYEVPDGTLVVGGGLASLDVVKILMLETVVRALAARGIRADLYEMERKGVKKVLDGHGLSLQALGLTGCTLIYRRRIEDMPVADPPDGATPEQVARTRATRQKLLNNFREKYLFHFQERLAPLAPIPDGDRLAGLRLQRTEIRNGKVALVPGEEVEIRAPLTISSIGSIPEPLPGVPMRGELYPVSDQDTGEMEGLPGVFAIGNAVTGKGNILVSLRHGRKVSQRMLESYLLGEGSGYEEVLAAAGTGAAARVGAVAERVAAAPRLSPGQIAAVEGKVRALQARIGFRGSYWDWIAKVRPARPPKH